MYTVCVDWEDFQFVQALSIIYILPQYQTNWDVIEYEFLHIHTDDQVSNHVFV